MNSQSRDEVQGGGQCIESFTAWAPGKLPNNANGEGSGHFHALKRIPIRGYCWRSERHENTWFVSHYVFKNYQKLKAKDTDRLGKNWTRIEVDGDER